MNGYLILLLVTICVTSAHKQDMKSNVRTFMRFRNAPSDLQRRRSWGQLVPSFPSRHKVPPQLNPRFLIQPSRIGNTRIKRPTSGFSIPGKNHGPSIGFDSPRRFGKARFKVSTRSRGLMKSSTNNMGPPALHRSSRRRGIIAPEKYSWVEGKRSSTHPLRNRFNKLNTSNVRPPLVNKARDARLIGSKRGRSVFQLALSKSGHVFSQAGSGTYKRSLRKTALSHPITQHRQIRSQHGSHILLSEHRTQPHMLSSNHKLPADDRTNPFKKQFKDIRSNFRSSSVKSPFSVALGFLALDRKIAPVHLTGISLAKAISKSTPLIHKSHFGSVNMPRHSTQVGAASSVNTVSNSSNIDQSGGTARNFNGSISGPALTAAGSASGPSAADNTIVASQIHMNLVPNSLPNNGNKHSGNSTLVSTSIIDSGKANTVAQKSQTLSGSEGVTQSNNSSPTGTVTPNIKKLDWLIKIVNTREGLEEAMDDGALLSRLQKSGPHTYAELMFALRKGSHFNEEIIADMKSEGQWDQLLNAAGISPNDRTEHGRNKLAWLTEIANKREGLEEALDDGGLLRRLQPTGPHTYEELMAALRKGSHFSDAVISDMKSEGQWDQLLKAAGINPLDIERQNRTSGTQNTDRAAANVQTDQARHHSVSTGQ